jgi:cytochrome c-type biogenesis protein
MMVLGPDLVYNGKSLFIFCMDYSLLIPAFIAGLVMFLAPCTLPLVPGYLAFISGSSYGQVADRKSSGQMRWRIFLNGLFFVIGFSVVFIVLGMFAGLLGGALGSSYRLWFTRIGGVFIIAFGLMMLDVIRIPFLGKEMRLLPDSLTKARGTVGSSFLLGAGFGAGWTPCIGPVLGSILFLASGSGTVWQGGLLLFVFAIGQAIPFLLIALFFGHAVATIKKLSPYLRYVSLIGGIFLIVLGVLMLVNRAGLLLSYGYRLFSFINYDALLDYL